MMVRGSYEETSTVDFALTSEMTPLPRRVVVCLVCTVRAGAPAVPVAFAVVTCPNFTNSMCRLPVTVARCYSDGTVICYLLPVLRMTSRLSILGQAKRRKYRGGYSK